MVPRLQDLYRGRRAGHPGPIPAGRPGAVPGSGGPVPGERRAQRPEPVGHRHRGTLGPGSAPAEFPGARLVGPPRRPGSCSGLPAPEGPGRIRALGPSARAPGGGLCAPPRRPQERGNPPAGRRSRTLLPGPRPETRAGAARLRTRVPQRHPAPPGRRLPSGRSHRHPGVHAPDPGAAHRPSAGGVRAAAGLSRPHPGPAGPHEPPGFRLAGADAAGRLRSGDPAVVPFAPGPGTPGPAGGYLGHGDAGRRRPGRARPRRVCAGGLGVPVCGAGPGRLSGVL